MGISSLQLNIFAMTKQKSTINRQMMQISDQRDLLAQQMNKAMETSETWYKDRDYKNFQQLDQQLDQEMELLETALDALDNNLKAIEEQKDNNVKDVPKLA